MKRLVLLALGFAAGCHEPTRPLSASGAWALASIEGAAPIAGSAVTLAFEGGRIHGFGGCNEYDAAFNGSRVVADTAGFVVIDLGATKRACDQPAGVQAQEQRYFELLVDASQSVRSRDQLRILDGQRRVVLLFVRN